MLSLDKTTCRQVATKEDYVKYFIPLQQELGRTTYADEVDVVYPQGGKSAHYVCFYEETPYCVFSLVTYADIMTMSLGSFICAKSFRGKGVSFHHLQKVYDKFRAQGYSLVLTTMSYGPMFASKFGVKPSGNVDFFTLKSENFAKLARPHENVSDAKTVCLGDVLAYDREVAGFDRSVSLELLVRSQVSKTVAFVEHGKVRGYAGIMTGDKDDKIGPLCADSDEVCEALVRSLLHGWQRDLDIKIPVPRIDDLGHRDFLTKLGFQKDEWVLSLYGHKPYSNDFRKTYGVFCLQFGI